MSRWMWGWQREGARRAAEGEWMLPEGWSWELESWGLMEVILLEVMVTSEGEEVPGRVTLVRVGICVVLLSGSTIMIRVWWWWYSDSRWMLIPRCGGNDFGLAGGVSVDVLGDWPL